MLPFTDFIEYDPATGKLYWTQSRRGQPPKGTEVGSTEKHGYRIVRFDNKVYKAHRLIWFMHYGEWPDGILDHINRDKSDNRIENLRIATPTENSRNSERYNYGASYHKRIEKWGSSIYKGTKKIHLGYFDTEQEAQQVYLEALSKEDNN